MKYIVTTLLLLLHTGTAAQQATPAPNNAKLYIISPTDGATVESPVKVLFGLSGMGIAPAGVQHKNTGHHHLLLNVAPPNIDSPIPADDKHLHFGKGQTETQLELSSGQHTLQLLLGDAFHRPHEPPVLSEIVTITVR
ncbi:MAG: DUF4399 domain-containing protein [Candidatus Porifericomitaceae bacterium WSBS_2022_MAG_OTU9]